MAARTRRTGTQLRKAGASLSAAAVPLLILMAGPAAHAAPGTSPGGERVYEQVSPVDKSGYDAFTTGPRGPGGVFIFPLLIGPSGEAVTFGSNGPFSGAPIGNQNQYLARRSSTGWATEAVSPPLQIPNVLTDLGVPALVGAGVDLERLVFGVRYSISPTAKRPNGNVVDIVARDPDGSLPLISRGSLGATEDDQYASFADLTPDGRFAVLSSSTPLEPAVPAGMTAVYLRDLDRQRTEVVSVLPDDTIATRADLGASSLTRLRDTSGGNASQPNFASLRRPGAVSQDGRRVAFSQAVPVPGQSNQHQLFLRVDGERTLDVGVSRRAVPTGARNRGAIFQWMTPDGAHLFFTSDGQLTNDAPATVALYRYDVNATGTSGNLVLVSGAADVDGGFVGASDDGTIVYFVTTTQLGGQGTAGKPNLYASGPDGTQFVATVSLAEDIVRQTTRYTSSRVRDVSTWTDQQARMTPDGRHLVFRSDTALTDDAGPGQSNLYRYRLGGGLTCVSCGDPTAGGSVRLSFPNLAPAIRTVHNLSDDGSRVYFETNRGFDVQDVNDHFDVYEWHDGQRNLVTSGRSASDSYLVDATDDGRDVFVLSYEQLAATDTDTAGDIYDVRVGGGFAARNGGLQDPAPCRGDDCRSLVPPLPGITVPGTASVVGPGNVVPPVERATRSAPVRITRTRSVGRTILVTVQTPGRGRLRTSGSGTRTRTRTTSRATRYTVRIPLSKTGRKRVGRAPKHRASFHVRIQFTPAHGRTTTTTTRVSVRG